MTDSIENLLEQQVTAALETGEGETVEFKRELPKNLGDLAKEVAALSTTRGGLVLIGVTDEGVVVGFTESRERVEGVLNLVKPSPRASVSITERPEGSICVIAIEKGSRPPYFANERPYIRVGSLSRPVEHDELRDIILAAEKPAVILDGWEDEPGAPDFAFSPGTSWVSDHVVLSMQFHQKNETPMGRLRAFFRGPGLEMEPTKPMDENEARHYQMKAANIFPGADPDHGLGDNAVGFEIQFNWAGAERHILWRAELRRLNKDRWRAEWDAESVSYWAVQD